MNIDKHIQIPEAKSQRSKSAKTKGKTGEREALVNIVLKMQEIERELGMFDDNAVSHLVQRNLQQSINGGHDIVGIPCVCLEVKRQEILNVNAWWLQACEQAARMKDGSMPVLMYRQNRQKWRVMMFAKLSCPPYLDGIWEPVEITFERFILFYGEIFRQWLLTARTR